MNKEVPSSESTSFEKQGTPHYPGRTSRRCCKCDRPGHLAWDSAKSKSDTSGKKPAAASTRKVSTCMEKEVMSYLESSSDSDNPRVNIVRVKDTGSKARFTRVQTQGVSMFRIVDRGADITIMGGNMFNKVASVARLKKRDFKKPD